MFLKRFQINSYMMKIYIKIKKYHQIIIYIYINKFINLNIINILKNKCQIEIEKLKLEKKRIKQEKEQFE